MINEKLNKDILDLITQNTKNINGLKAKLLWTNPNPQSTFNEQDVTLNSDDYDILEVFYNYNTGNNNYIQSARTFKGKGCILSTIGYGAPNRNRRKFDYINDTKLHFYNANTETSYDGDYLVPVYIVGYKTGLFN